MFKKIFITLIILIALAFGGLTYYVSTIDWNNYKNKMAEQLENVTGKRVVINGNVGLTFWPRPHLSATNIKIYNKNANPKMANTPLAEIKEMVADLSLMPLIHKRFVIDKMNLNDSRILIEFFDNGQTNWYTEVDPEQSFALSGVDIAFNSIMLQNSVVHIINPSWNFDSVFNKVNADISAQSLVGPFRIDGNFIKDNTPAGFALNIGTLSESFATSLNLVLTHPSSESYARFDGSILSNNSELKGNFTIESQKPSVFLNTISGQNLLDEKYNYPVASSIDLSVNPKEIDLSSFIVKYGENLAGSGRVLIPLKENIDNKKIINISFEMTDLDLMPFASVLKEYLKKYDGTKKAFSPNFEYDVVADITATRALLNDETIRDFKLSADLINNRLNIKNLSGLMVGDTDIYVKGDVFEHEKALSYSLNIQSSSQDFLKFLKWLKIEPKTYAPSTYRNARLAASVSGNLGEIKITPFEFGFDKIETSGIIGLKRDRKNAWFIVLQSENINFDNYLPPIKEDEKNTALTDRLKNLLSHFKLLNETDVTLNLSLGLGIYDKVPFENTSLKLTSTDGQINLEKLEIERLVGASLHMQGKLSNLGANPSFENLKYQVKTDDFGAFNQKLKLNLPDWPLFTKVSRADIQSIASGTFNTANAKIVAQMGKNSFSYAGRLSRQGTDLSYRGKIKIKAPDFLDFANQINLDYNPRRLIGNVLTFDGDIDGTLSNFRAENISAFIGTNQFTGRFSYTKRGDKPLINADISTNLFEFDRFVYEPAQQGITRNKKEQHTFIEMPRFDTKTIDYGIFENFDLNGTFHIKNLSYQDTDVENVSFKLNVDDGRIIVRDFIADKKPAVYKANFDIDTKATNKINGDLSIENGMIENFGGSLYQIKNANMYLKAKYEASSLSVADFIKTLNGNIEFDFNNMVFEGFNIAVIVDDLITRTRSVGLDEFLHENLTGGQTTFDRAQARIDLKNGEYTIKDAVLRLDDLTSLELKGNGSLSSWQTDLKLTIDSQKIKQNLPTLSFTLTEMLSNPVLKIDDETLKETYDAHWAELERQQKELAEAKEKALKEKMSAAQEIVARQTNFINTEVMSRLKRYKPFSANVSIQNVYESVNIEADDMLKTLRDLASKAYRDYQDGDIDKINLQTQVFEPVLPELVTRLDNNYVDDLKIHIASNRQRINQINQNTKEKSVNYQNTLNSYTMRLMQIGSLVVLDRLDEVKTNKAKIETDIKEIASLDRQAGALIQKLDEERRIGILDNRYQESTKLLENTKSHFEDLNTALENLFLYIQDVLYFEQTGEHKTPQVKEKKVPDVASETTFLEQPQKVEAVTKAESESLPPSTFDEKSEQKVSPLLSEPVEEKSELVVEPQVLSSPEIVPERFKPQETVKEVLQSQEQLSENKTEKAPDETPKQVVVEKIETPKIPLLVETEDDYMSKPAVSGTIVKKGAKSEENNFKQPAKSLLKPIDGEVVISGSVKRK